MFNCQLSQPCLNPFVKTSEAYFNFYPFYLIATPDPAYGYEIFEQDHQRELH